MVARCGYGGEGKEIAGFRIPAETDIAKGFVEGNLGVGLVAIVGGTNGAESHRFHDTASSRRDGRQNAGCRWTINRDCGDGRKHHNASKYQQTKPDEEIKKKTQIIIKYIDNNRSIYAK